MLPPLHHIHPLGIVTDYILRFDLDAIKFLQVLLIVIIYKD